MIYLASPYSDVDPNIMQDRYDDTQKACALLNTRHPMHTIYSPIALFHPIAALHNLPTDADFWWAKNRDAINSCEMMFVLTLDGYHESLGVAQEINYCRLINKTYRYVNQWGDHVL